MTGVDALRSRSPGRCSRSWRQRGPCAGPGRPSERAVRDDRRPDGGVGPGDDEAAGRPRRAGHHFTQSISTYPLCCPSRATYLTGQYSHNHGVIHNAAPFGGYMRLDNFNTLPVWMQNAGYRTIHVGRYLNGYGTQNPDAPRSRRAGRTGTPRWTRPPSTSRSGLMNENGRLFEKRADDGEFQTDYLGRRAIRGDRPGRGRPAPVLPLAHLPGAAQRARRSTPTTRRRCAPPPPRRATATRSRASRCRRGPNFGRARRARPSPRSWPTGAASRAEDVAAIQENYQQELESLLSVDDAVGRPDRHAARHRRAGQHGDHLHLRQRLLPRRARRAVREGASLRAGHPHAADHARARACRVARRLNQLVGERGPGAHDPRHRRTPRPGGCRTAARCST